MLRTAKLVLAGNGEVQDRAEIFQTVEGLVAVVADGAGGIGGGAEAADFVIAQIRAALSVQILDFSRLNEFLASIDREMAAAGNLGETTCVIVILANGKIVGASVGDSGAWIIGDKGIDDLTRSQQRKPLIGSGTAFAMPFEKSQFQGTLLLASDGLLKYTSQESIASIVRTNDLDEVAKRLTDLVRYTSGALPDDVAVILVKNV